MGRDLYVADEEYDVIFNLSNMEVAGDFFNGTTATYPHRYGDKSKRPGPPPPPDGVVKTNPEEKEMEHVPSRGDGDDLLGPKNLGLNLKNATVCGIVSATKGEYREGVEVIDASNLEELSYNIHTPQPAVNNGVIVTLDGDSCWIVTDTSYLTKLVLDEGAVVKAPEGKQVKLLVDGAETAISAGSYQGKLTLCVE